MEKQTRYLALDVSTKTGYAVIETTEAPGELPRPRLIETGVLRLPKKINEYGTYPFSYVDAAAAMVVMLGAKLASVAPDVLVVEETNLGRQRYTQKGLEFLHHALLVELARRRQAVVYLSTSKWRSALGLRLAPDDKKNNKLLRKARDLVLAPGGVGLDLKALAAAKKAMGVKGKVSPKHLAVRYANSVFGLDLKMKQNDEADAICLIMGFLAGAEICTGND